jgi:CubicO group peptidase (beta-lactamase class C family)
LALSFPVAHPPGESWNYSTLDTQLISAIVQEAAGEPLASFAAANLFAPLGIDAFEWWNDGMGTTIGGQNLSMTPRNMAKLGLLYLHGGVWEGQQLLPAEWIKTSLTPQNERLFYPPSVQVETVDWYGYHWYTWKGDWFYGYRSFQAAGYGGQQVLFFPELDLMLVTTANLAGVTPEVDIQQRTALNELFLEVIFPALADVELER